MDPKRHPSNNRLFGPPANWDDRGGLLRLPALDATQGKVGGIDVFVTLWKPSDDELTCLLRGGLVQLACVGGQPAVAVNAVDENASPILLAH